jgi:eukaryotic-like serine/threonine-protein kinase
VSREGSLERLVGQVLASRYRVGARLGVGAMGMVFRAEHVKVGRKLAIKVLHPRRLEHAKYRRRFDREAELAGKLHHPNVAGVIDVGITPEGLRYLVMEFADGPTLGQLLDAGPMPGRRMLNLAKQLCDGLHHAHEHGLIHRDFKPDNVIVERGDYGEETPRILDFGIAIALTDLSAGERARLTTEGMVLGTPHYMAPEHVTGESFDHRIDLFAFGVICYEMLTGEMPFEGSGVEVARAYLSRPIPEMKQRAPHVEVDPLLEAFTRALLARSADARPPSAKAARALLDLIANDRAGAARELGVKLRDQRRTLPISPAPPPVRVPSGTKPPPPAAWNHLPTEKMSPDPEAPPAVLLAAPAIEAAASPAEPPAAAAAPAPAAMAQPEEEPARLGPAPARSPAPAPAMAPRASVYVGASQPPAAAPMPSHLATEHVRPLRFEALARTRPLWIAAALVAVGLCAIGVVALRGGSRPAAPAVAAIRPEQRAQVPLRPIAPSPPALLAVPRAPGLPSSPPPMEPAPADATVAHPPSGAAIAPAATAPPRPAPRPPVAPAVAAPAAPAPAPAEAPRVDPTASTIAELYGAVGRALKRLDDVRGQEATYDLWPRFRLIRILEALRSPEARAPTYHALRYLEREIVLRAQ